MTSTAVVKYQPVEANKKSRNHVSSLPNWLDRLRATLGLRHVAAPQAAVVDQLARTKALAQALQSERGEASGAVIARELQDALRRLDAGDRLAFQKFLANGFQPDAKSLRTAAESYIAKPSAETAARLAQAADPPRQEILRRMNTAAGGTSALVAMRKDISGHLRSESLLKLLDADLKHLFASWFNRGFLELRRIDWQSPAAVLEKLIAYEAVHEIRGWDDLRRRLAPDRRCFAFFHPALPGEPLIFVEVALVKGLAEAVQPLLVQDHGDAGNDAARDRAAIADTAIFYSISNCQDGLRGISFGNFLIKQVVSELKFELPNLARFSTLSPVPGFRKWLVKRAADTGDAEIEMLAHLDTPAGWPDQAQATSLRPPIMRACAHYLTHRVSKEAPADPVARFHLGNGARLEKINWMGNSAARGIEESFGVMVNYLYDLNTIENNHEVFVNEGTVARSADVDAWLSADCDDAPRLPRGRKARTLQHVQTN